MLFCAIFLLLPFVVLCDTTTEDGVINLNKANFEQFIKDREWAMVLFAIPTCGHCRAFEPEFIKAANILKNDMSKILAGKVDGSVDADLITTNNITGYPTLKLYKSGKVFEYSGKRHAADVVSWFKRKTQHPLKRLSTVDEAKAFIDSENIVVVGFVKSKNDEALKILEDVADSLDDFSFGLVESEDVFNEFGVTSNVQVVLFKKFDEHRADFDGPLTVAALKDFAMRESVPSIVEFSPDSAEVVFRSPVKYNLIVFMGKSDRYEERKHKLEPVAKKTKGKVHIIIVDSDFEDHKRILEFFGLTTSDVPAYRMVLMEREVRKYVPEKHDFSEDYLVSFIDDVVSGKRKPAYKSEEIPPESSDPVRILVGKNYNDVVLDKNTKTLVCLHAPWCGHCQKFMTTLDELGKAYHGKEGIIIAKMNAIENEVEGLEIAGFPTILLYPKGSTAPIEYNGDRSLESLKIFIDSDGKQTGKEEEKPKEKDSKDEL